MPFCKDLPMAKVQTTFTYTVPARDSDTCAPAAPIRCGCDNLILILKDPALTVVANRGIIEVVIREVSVSARPLHYTDPSSGVASKVWRFDYIFEYDTDDFVDPTYRLRKCDILHNCCRGCAQEYTDRKLQGYVQSVQGVAVDNTDPRNPVIPQETTTTLSRVSAPNQANTLTYLNEAGVTYTFVEGINTLNIPAGCTGVGPTQAIKSMSLSGTTLSVQSAAMPSFVGAGAVDALDPGSPIYVIPVQSYDLNEIIINLTNNIYVHRTSA